MKRQTLVWRALVGILLGALGAGMLAGQALTGTIKGGVADEDGAVLPGVTVVVESPQLLGGSQVQNTDEEGKYRFVNLAPGQYTVTAEMSEFGKEKRENQAVQVGVVTTVDFVLKVAMEDSMVVTGTPAVVVDKEKSGVGFNVTQQLMQDIPIARQYQSIMAMLPGVKGDGNPNVHGESQRSNQILVDGVDTTDPVTGTFGTNLTFEAIQDIQYSTAGYLPEYGQVLGAVANIVTRSGGNEVHGGMNFNTFQPSFRSKHSDPIKQERVNETTNYEVSGYVGGPVRRDKVWYFGTFEMYDGDTSQEAVDYSNTVRVYYWLGKISSQLSPNNRLVVQAHGDPYEMNGENLSVDWARDANPNRKQGGGHFSGNWTWVLSKASFLESRASYSRSILDLQGLNGDTYGVSDVDASLRSADTNEPFNLVNWGNQGNQFAQSLSLNRRYRKMFESDYSHLVEKLGDHEIKAGMEVEFANETQRSRGGWEQLSETWIRQGFLDRWQTVPGARWDGTRHYSLYVHPEDLLEDGRRRMSFYMQDKWTWWRAAINYGFRIDDTIAENDVGQDVLNFTTISPRLGASVDVLGNGKTVVRGSVGRYFENPMLMFPGAFNQRSLPSYRYMYNWATHEYDILRSVIGGPSGYVIYNNQPLKSPYKNEVTVGFEHQIISDFSVGVDVVRSRTRDILEDIELNQIWEEYQDDSWQQAGLLPGTVPNWRVVGYRNGQPQVVFALTNPSEARRRYDGVEMTFNKRFSNRWQLFGSYTWSKAKGTVEDAFTDFADSPQEIYNRDGYLSHDRRHDIVLNGSYHLPWGIRAGARMQVASGAPFTFEYRDGEDQMKVWLAPRGGAAPFAFDVMDRNGKVWKHYDAGDALRGNWLKNVDLRVEKTLGLASGELGVYVDFYNVFNWSDMNGFGSDIEHVGDAPTFQTPRRMQFLTRYTF